MVFYYFCCLVVNSSIVEFETVEQAQAAIDAMNGSELHGRKVTARTTFQFLDRSHTCLDVMCRYLCAKIVLIKSCRIKTMTLQTGRPTVMVEDEVVVEVAVVVVMVAVVVVAMVEVALAVVMVVAEVAGGMVVVNHHIEITMPAHHFELILTCKEYFIFISFHFFYILFF